MSDNGEWRMDDLKEGDLVWVTVRALRRRAVIQKFVGIFLDVKLVKDGALARVDRKSAVRTVDSGDDGKGLAALQRRDIQGSIASFREAARLAREGMEGKK